MGIISWVVLGVIAGFIASKIVNKQGSGFIMDLCLGIVGAVVGGFISTRLGFGAVDGFNLGSVIIAVVGAVIVLFIYHALTGRRVPN